MIAHYKKETRPVSVWALGLLALFGAVVLTDAAPQSSDHSGPLLSGQPRARDYQFIFTGDATRGEGYAKGVLGCVVTESGIHLKGIQSVSTSSRFPLGAVSMYHLQRPNLLVKFPLEPGSEWSDQWKGYWSPANRQWMDFQSVTKVSVDPAALALAAGTFSDCIVIETKISVAETAHPDDTQSVINATCGTRTIWLARGVGIVRMIYAHRDRTTTEMSLTDYTLGGETQEYFPTVDNAKWSYLFKSDAFQEGIKEEWVLSDQQEVGYRSFEDLFPTPQGGQSFPTKEAGETEGAYQVRVRHYVRVYEEAQAKSPRRSGESLAPYEARTRARVRNKLRAEMASPAAILKRAGESEAAYQARLRAAARNRTLARTRTLAESEPPLTIAKRPGESEAAYQARLRAAARARTLARGTSLPLEFHLVKRQGEAEDLYQARMRAAARNLSMTEVILTQNGAEGRFKAFTEARRIDGDPLARACFQFELSAGMMRSKFQGSKGPCPEPYQYATIWSYLCGLRESVFHLSTASGTPWKQPGEARSVAMSSVAAIESVTLESGTYEGCIRIVTAISGARHSVNEANRFINGLRTLWFAPGVGLVKMVYASNNGKRTEAELVDFTVAAPTASYMPLALGNEWTYRWTTGYRDYDVIETLRIAAPGERVHMVIPDNQTSGPDWELVE